MRTQMGELRRVAAQDADECFLRRGAGQDADGAVVAQVSMMTVAWVRVSSVVNSLSSWTAQCSQ